MSAHEKAVDRLAWMLHASDAVDGPAWVFDEWPIADWAALPESDRTAATALAVRMMRAAGIVAVDPALVDAVRAAPQRPASEILPGGVHDAHHRALAELGRAIMAQLGGGR